MSELNNNAQTTSNLDMFCQGKFDTMHSALTALKSLSSEERSAVMAALKQDRDLPIRKSVCIYRHNLAVTLGVAP